MPDPNPFVLPSTPAGQDRVRRRRRVLRLGAAVLAVALVAGGVITWRTLERDRDQRALEDRWRCPGLDRRVSEEFALSRPGGPFAGQCLGWTVTRDYPFGSTEPTVQSIVSKIVTENRAVRDQATQPDGKPYVRVAVMMPMTWESGGAMGVREITHALQGSYAAQKAANAPRANNLGNPTPLVQLVLANDGTDQTGWAPLDPAHAAATDQRDWPGVVAQLAELVPDRKHPLVAVTGMGISVPATQQAATALGSRGIPSIGAVVTADDMIAPSFFKVSPSNRQYIDSLAAWVTAAKTRGVALQKAFLVYDRNPEDNYVRTLRQAFLDVFDTTYGLAEHGRGFTGSKPPVVGTPRLFDSIVRDICASTPDVIFYSGRDRDLRPFVDALRGRGSCQNPVRPLLIATGTTGLTLTDAEANSAKLGVLDASSTDPPGWAQGDAGTPRWYPRFREFFTGPPQRAGLGFSEQDLRDGYAVMHRDAVIAAVWAARQVAAEKAEGDNPAAVPAGAGRPDLPSAADVRNALFGLQNQKVPGGSGELYFLEQDPEGLWPRNKPVAILTLGDLARQLPRVPTYLTR